MAMINVDPHLVQHLPKVGPTTKLLPQENVKTIMIYPWREPWGRYDPDPGFNPWPDNFSNIPPEFGPVPMPMPRWPRRPGDWHYYDPDPGFSPWPDNFSNIPPEFGPVPMPMPRWPRRPRDWHYYDPDPGFSPWPDNFPNIPPEFGPVPMPMPRWPRRPDIWDYYDPQPDPLFMHYDRYNPNRAVQLMANKDELGTDAGAGYTYDRESGKLIGGIREDEYLKPPPSLPPSKSEEPQDPKKGISKEQIKSAINNILKVTTDAAKTYNELSRQGQGVPNYNPTPSISSYPRIGGDLSLDVPPPAFDKLPYIQNQQVDILSPYKGLQNFKIAATNNIVDILNNIDKIPQNLEAYGDYWGRNAQTYHDAFWQNPTRSLLGDIPVALSYGAVRGANDTLQGIIDLPYGLTSIYTGKNHTPPQIPNVRNLTDRYGNTFENKFSKFQYVSDIGSLLPDIAELGLGGSFIGKTVKGVRKKQKVVDEKIVAKKVGTYYEDVFFDSLRYLDDTKEIKEKFATTNKQILKQIPKDEQELALSFVDHCLNKEQIKDKVVMKIEGVKQALKHKKDLENLGFDTSLHGLLRATERINPKMIPDVEEIYKTVDQADKYLEKIQDGKRKRFYLREFKKNIKKKGKRYIEVILNDENKIVTIEYVNKLPKKYASKLPETE